MFKSVRSTVDMIRKNVDIDFTELTLTESFTSWWVVSVRNDNQSNFEEKYKYRPNGKRTNVGVNEFKISCFLSYTSFPVLMSKIKSSSGISKPLNFT